MFKTTYSQRPVSNHWGALIVLLLSLPTLKSTIFYHEVGAFSPLPGESDPRNPEMLDYPETTLLAFAPSIQAAKHIAGVAPATSGTAGNFDVITEILVQNTGTTNLTDFSLVDDLALPFNLGTAFVAVIDTPQFIPVGAYGTLSTATTLPDLNVNYNGTGDLLGGGGMLEPGEIFILQFRYEVNPDAAGAPVILKNQAYVSATGMGPGGTTLPVNDDTDSGYTPQSTNPGRPGDSGGSDDPTPLTNCWDLVTNGLTCNFNLQVSLNEDCIAAMTPEMVLEGEYQQCTGDGLYPLGGYYRISMVTTATGALVPDLVPATLNVYEIDGSYIGQTLTVKVMEIVNSNHCWGQITLEDKLKPVFDCVSPVEVFCNVNLAGIAPPAVSDNCDPDPVISLAGTQVIDNNICDDGIYRIRRTYTAIDAAGNQSLPCIQDIHVVRPPVDFPQDIVWTCTQYGTRPAIVNPTQLHLSITDTDPGTPAIDVSPVLPLNILNNTGSGRVNVSNAPLCSFNVSFSDEIVPTCGSGFKILRTWLVIDWCNGTIISTGPGGEDNVQVIEIADKIPPLVTADSIVVSANIPGQSWQPCRSEGFLPPPAVTDDCSSFSVQIITSVGEAVYLGQDGSNGGFIPSPGLPLGSHLVTYVVTDACGNQTSIDVPLTVIDNISPVAVCDAVTDVNLGTNGTAEVFAMTFDDGSTDNCCLDHFEARRMDDPCDDGHDDTVFGSSVVFCCDDVANSPIMVVFRVFDCYGNFNDCMVEVKVNDKQNPVLVSCPANQRMTCDDFADQYEEQLDDLAGNPFEQNELFDGQFGTPVFTDNCGLSLTKNIIVSLDQCSEGTVVRTWFAMDEGGLVSATCTQTIFVDHVSDWVVTFPADISVNCGDTLPSFGQPQVFFNTCEMIGTSWDDETFYTVQGACFKIERTWQVINWCVLGDLTDQEPQAVEASEDDLNIDLDGDGDMDTRTFRDSWTLTKQPTAAQANQTTDPDTDLDSDPWDGFIEYIQTMKVIDTVDPVFETCPATTACIIDSLACVATVVLDTPDVMDCSPNINFSVQSDLGTGFGPFTNVGSGTYSVTYTASDNCGNQSSCTTTVTVSDCKKPNVFCNTGITATLMNTVPPSVPVNAAQLDAGSFDNCPGDLIFSFSPNVNDTVMVFDCSHIGTDSVEIWVTDASGNQDFCKTTVTIQLNAPNQCVDDTLVVILGGYIENEDNEPTGGVTVSLSGQSNGSVLTPATGGYTFPGVPIGNDVTVTPVKDDNPLNGVTTFDLVAITKHILNIQPLGSPYKMIAADANNSKSVTTADLVEIRKLILFINDEFPNNTSWRFVAADYVFPVPSNPWFEPFPEIINFNNIPADVLDADFVAVKIGDVNNSAASVAGGGEDRNAYGSLVFETTDKDLTPGDNYTVDFKVREFRVSGYQFTLDFDTEMLDFVEVVPAQAAVGNFGLGLVEDGAITVSWNDSETKPAEDELAFSLVFKSKSNERLSRALQLGSRFTKAEAYGPAGEMLDVQLQFNGDETATDGFALFQNRPNPFSRQTVIGFRLPKASPARLSITDVSGKLVKVVEGNFTEGYHEIQLEKQELPSGGIFYYQLETPTNFDTKKMVLIN